MSKSLAPISVPKQSVFFYYGWIIMIASLVIGTICFGVRYSYGVFFTSLESEFGLSRAATSGIYSAYMILCGVTSIIGGWALDKYGPKAVAFTMSLFTGLSLLASSQVHAAWQLYITYSIMQAIGNGAMVTVASSTTSRWFVKKRGLVIGITSSAGAAGDMFVVPLASILLLHFDWRASFIIMGIAVWIILMPVSQLMKREPGEIGLLPDGIKPETDQAGKVSHKLSIIQEGLTLRQAYRVREFWFLTVMWIFSGLGAQMLLTHLVPHAIDFGISPINATFIISLLGLGAILGRVIDGKLSDNIGRKLLAIVSAVIQVVTLVALIYARELWILYILGFLFGYGWGGLGTESTLLVGDIFGLKSMGTILGAATSGFNLGAAIGPTFGGMIFDITGAYSGAFAFAAFGMVIATFLCVLIRPGKAKAKEQANDMGSDL